MILVFCVIFKLPEKCFNDLNKKLVGHKVAENNKQLISIEI